MERHNTQIFHHNAIDLIRIGPGTNSVSGDCTFNEAVVEILHTITLDAEVRS